MEASVEDPANPLLAIPMLAIEKCARVNLELGLNKKEA